MFRWQDFLSLRDWGVVAAITALSLFGTVALFSLSTATADGSAARHLVAVGLGMGSMLVLGRLRSHHLRTLALPWYIVSLTLLALVLVGGREIRGTTGWFVIGSVSLQPVEFMKIGLVLILASYFARARAHASPWALMSKSLWYALPPILLTLLQPDAGSALVLGFIWAFLVFLQIPWRARLTLLAGVMLAGLVGWFLLFQTHQRERLLVFIDPSRDPFGAGYNIRQSIIAVGSGKIFGRGIGAGSQSQLQFLPEAATDFSFALIAEELGLLGALGLLTAFLILFGRMVIQLARAPTDFAAFVIVGIGGWWFFQTVVYIGMNLGLAPIIGIPLPFVSYGGSSQLASYLAAGCVLASCAGSNVPRESSSHVKN